MTNDVVGGLAPGSGLYTALLSPQGKILFDFLVTEGDGALLLDVARDAARGAAQETENVQAARQGGDRGARHSLGVYVGSRRAIPTIGGRLMPIAR